MIDGAWLIADGIRNADVRLSAEQREQQRREMANAITFLLQRVQHIERVSEEAFRAVGVKLDAVEGGLQSTDGHLQEVDRQHHDFTSMTFWQRLRWLVRGQ